MNPRIIHNFEEDKENTPNAKRIKFEYSINNENYFQKSQDYNLVDLKAKKDSFKTKEEVFILKENSSVQVKSNKRFPDDLYSPR